MTSEVAILQRQTGWGAAEATPNLRTAGKKNGGVIQGLIRPAAISGSGMSRRDFTLLGRAPTADETCAAHGPGASLSPLAASPWVYPSTSAARTAATQEKRTGEPVRPSAGGHRSGAGKPGQVR